MKVVLRDKFITLSYVKNLESTHASNLTAYLKDLEQRNQTLWSRWQETIKLRAEIKKIETATTKQYKDSMEQSWFFEKKISNIDKPLSKLTKIHKKKIQINKTRGERGA